MRRTPISDRPDDDDLEANPYQPPARVRRIETVPGGDQAVPRGDPRYGRASRWRQPPPRRRPPPLGPWLLRGAIGVAILGAIWLVLQFLFPIAEQRSSTTNQPAETPVPALIGAPEPPPVTALGPPPAALVAQPSSEPSGDRLPGLSTPAAKPTAGAPTPAAPVQQATAPPAGPGVPLPIPPPADATVVGSTQAPAAPAPTLPPPAPAAPQPSTGPLLVQASVTPANPISEDAVVTVNIAVTWNGAPAGGAFCMSTVYFRTATVRLPTGGVATGPQGIAWFTIDAHGTTYNRYVPVDVSCSTRGTSVTARTGFTPLKRS